MPGQDTSCSMHQAAPSVDHPLVLVQANCWLGVGGA